MKRLVARVVLVVVGGGIGLALPVPGGGARRDAVEPPPPRAPEPSAAPLRTEASPSSDPQQRAPCLPESALENELAAIESQLDLERDLFEERWGTPMERPHGTDAATEAARYRSLLEDAPDRAWSTVDCSFHPCVGLFVTETPLYPWDVKEMLGLPNAHVRVGTRYTDARYVYEVQIAFTDEPLDPLQERWADELAKRLYNQHEFDLGAVASGEELAE